MSTRSVYSTHSQAEHAVDHCHGISTFQHSLRAGFSWWEAWGPWWEAWAQWRIWDFRKGLTIELQGFKN